ncbi:hypothetical protein GCM10011504_58990 [Siccirubricoccus deserti]|nr:hypothetical protein GCM10011504_58990 [Siccirubricoccus deserti]
MVLHGGAFLALAYALGAAGTILNLPEGAIRALLDLTPRPGRDRGVSPCPEGGIRDPPATSAAKARRSCIEACSSRGQEPHPCVGRGIMVDVWIALSRLNADLFSLAAGSVGFGWRLLAAGAPWTSVAPAPWSTDLITLGLDRMPSSSKELRRAYRQAAKAAHPDAGGSADAFRAVSEAFGRLAGRHAPAA